jgi:membrane protease YdiL (CAAX protease family)
MVAFALCAHREELLVTRLIAAAAAAVALASAVGAGTASQPATVAGQTPRPPRAPGRARWASYPPAAVAGFVLAVAYRLARDRPAVPTDLTWMLLLAPAIGCIEEVLYRGFVQGALRPLGAWPAVLIAAAAHTAYKVALFALPPGDGRYDMAALAVGTFVVGVALGGLRRRAGLAAPVLFHAVFDVVAYADAPLAPWWVW